MVVMSAWQVVLRGPAELTDHAATAVAAAVRARLEAWLQAEAVRLAADGQRCSVALDDT